MTGGNPANEAAAAGVPAPELLEVAQTWWDVERVPVVTWNQDGTAYDLVDPDDPAHRLELVRLATPPAPPARRIAEVLAEGLAACDFPPTEQRASPNRVAATLRVARLSLDLPDPS